MKNSYFIACVLMGMAMLGVLEAEEPWEEDAELAQEATTQESATQESPATWLLRFYKQNISDIDGKRSHYQPSSSIYTRQAIQMRGFFMGVIMGCDRLMRENDDPWLYSHVFIDGFDLKVDAPDPE